MATTLLTSDLRDFSRKAAQIHTVAFISILKYIRLHCADGVATLYKTNLHDHLCYTCSYEGEPADCLLDEHILRSVVLADTEQTVISLMGGRVTIGSVSHSVPTESYPVFPVSDAPMQPLEHIDQLRLAGHFAQLPDGTNNQVPWTTHVHMNHGHVYSHDGRATIYIKPVDSSGALILSRAALNVISGYGWQYCSTDKVDIYQRDNITYAFDKPNCATPVIKTEQYESRRVFKLPRKELLDYLRVTMSLFTIPEDSATGKKKEDALVCITTDALGVTFAYHGAVDNIVSWHLPCEEGHEITIQARYLLNIVNNINFETFSFSMPNPSTLVIKTCDEDYTAVLLGVNTQTV